MIRLKTESQPGTPSSKYTRMYVDEADNHVKTIDENGDIIDLSEIGGFSDEQIEALLRCEAQNSPELLNGGFITINADNTKFDISPYHAHYVDSWTDPENPETTIIDNPTGRTGITPLYLTTEARTVIAIDKDDNIHQFKDIPKGEDARTYIGMGVVIHANKTTINSISDATQGSTVNIGGTFADFRRVFGTINDYGNVFSPASATTIKKSFGEVFGVGQNAKNNKKNPNFVATDSVATVVLVPFYRDGVGYWTTGSPTTTPVFNLYDDGSGTLQSVSVNDWTIRPLYLATGSGTTFIGYGQKLYNSKAEAIAGINEDTVETYDLTDNLVLRGWMVYRGGTADLTLETDGEIREAPKFLGGGSAGGSATSTLQEAYANSSATEITTDATRLALTIKEGTDDLTALVYEGKNFADETTFSVNGRGEVKHSSGWSDMIVSFSYAGTGTNAPTETDDVDGFRTLSFGVNDEITQYHHVNHNYTPASDAYPHIHWVPTTGMITGETVVWEVKYKLAKGHDQNDSFFGGVVTFNITYTAGDTRVAGNHVVSECVDGDAFDMLEPDTIVGLKFKRLSGTYSDPIYAYFADIHHRSDREVTLNKAPNFYT